MTEAARGDRHALEPVEEIPVLGGAALEGDVGERQPARALVRDERAALEVLDVRHLDGQLASLLEARVTDVVDLDDELELLVEATFGAGPIVIPMTPAMRRFLFAMLRKAGKTPEGGSGRDVVVVQVPARPFLRPAFKQFEKGAQKRFLGRVAGRMGMGPDVGKGGSRS